MSGDYPVWRPGCVVAAGGTAKWLRMILGAGGYCIGDIPPEFVELQRREGVIVAGEVPGLWLLTDYGRKTLIDGIAELERPA